MTSISCTEEQAQRPPHRCVLLPVKSLSEMRREAESKALMDSSGEMSGHIHLLGCCGGFPPGGIVWSANFDQTLTSHTRKVPFGLRHETTE